MKYRKALTFSYDDGIEQDRKLVDIFNKYGMKATFNLNTGIQSNESCFEINGIHIQCMEQEGLDQLYKGHEIAVHGFGHISPESLSKDEYKHEFVEDAKNIERLYGKYPCGMAYAYGTYNDEVIAYLKDEGFKYGMVLQCQKNPLNLKVHAIIMMKCCSSLPVVLLKRSRQKMSRCFFIYGGIAMNLM